MNAGTLQKQAPSSLVATMASPDGHSLAKTRGQDHTGSRESWEWGHNRADTCTQDSRPSLPTHVPRLCLRLTFLHGDGGLLLPQPQQDEEEDQRDEDLKSQDPLERVNHMKLTAVCPLPAQG